MVSRDTRQGSAAAEVRLLLELVDKELSGAGEMLDQHRLAHARRRFLRAAENLLKAAKLSDGEFKRIRMQRAEALMELAEKLPQSQGGPSPRAEKETSHGADAQAWKVESRPRTRFKDVAGLGHAIEEIKMKLVYPFTHPDKAERFNIPKGGGVLLYGPPGTGKTLLARAVAGEVDACFYNIRPSDIMSKWVGEAEQNIRRLFKEAKSHDRSVIFIDEVEALVPKRRSTSSTVMARVVPQILSELEGFDEKEGCLLFIGATNEPWSLDPAMLRPGRFDSLIYVPLPERRARRQMLELQMSGRPVSGDVDFDVLADALEGYSGADIRNVCLKAATIPFIEAIRGKGDRRIERRDFEAAIASTPRSVSRDELKLYERYHASLGR